MSPRPKGPLGRRLLVAFLLASLVPMTASTLVGFMRSRHVVARLMTENVGKTAQLYAAGLDGFLGEQRTLLRTLPSSSPIDAPLDRAVESTPHLEALLQLDADGERAARGGEVSPWMGDACRQLLGDPGGVVTRPGAGHAHHVVVAVPREPGGGVLCGQVTFLVHQDLMAARAMSTVGGVAYIVDRAGSVVCHDQPDAVSPVQMGQQLVGSVAEIAAQGRAWSGSFQGEEGRHYAAFAPAKGLPWGVWVEIPQDLADEALAPLIRDTAIFALAFAVALIGVVVLLVRRMVEPVEEVAAAARVITEGRYGETLPARGDDEIAALVRAFNRMSLALRDSYAQLDERVEQRTRELEAARARLVHQEKMAALGVMAAGLAHEIGNPLASMSSELEMLERAWDPEEARASLPVLRQQIRRISKLLRELVDFGRPPRDSVEDLDAGEVVEEVLRLLRHDPRSRGVSLAATIDEGLGPVRTDRDRLIQVLLNLGLNALDALGGEGSLAFRAAAAPGGEARFEVRDSGPGLDPEAVERVFEPFFTTKAPGAGAGLGLFVSERIVDRLGGRIELIDREAPGAAFAVVLPRRESDG